MQWLVISASITSWSCKKLLLPIIRDKVFDMALVANGGENFLNNAKFLKSSDRRVQDVKVEENTEYDKKSNNRELKWVFREFCMVSNFVKKIFFFIMFVGISMVPIIGPAIVNQINAPRRGFSYMKRFFYLSGFDKVQTRDFQYEHFGLFLCFGTAAGILEFLPFSPIITMISNTVGAAKWSISLLKEKERKNRENKVD